jgi:hypothetical protein
VEAFFRRVLKVARPYLSGQHFSVGSTLTEVWASHKSFRPKEEEPGAGRRNRELSFHGEVRSNDTHPIYHGRRGSSLQEVPKQRGKTELFGSRVDGEPDRAVGQDEGHARRRRGGAGGRLALVQKILAAKLRPGNVHRADGWEAMLLPEIERQRQNGKEVAFRGDAAPAKPRSTRHWKNAG